MSSVHRQKHLGICLPTVGSQTWVRSGWEFFRPSGESNPRPWRWIKLARDQHVKCNERRTRPCHRAYYIRGSTPFLSCVEVRSSKLVSSEDRTGARAPSPSYCSTEGVAPLHTGPPGPVHTAPPVPVLSFLFSLKSRQCNRTGPTNDATGIIEQLPTSLNIHCAVASIPELFTAPLPTEKNNILIVKISLRHWLLVPNFFIELPAAVCSR